MSAPPARAARLQPVHLLEDVRRQPPDPVEIVHALPNRSLVRRNSLASRALARNCYRAAALPRQRAPAGATPWRALSSAAISLRIVRSRPPLRDQRQLRLDRLDPRRGSAAPRARQAAPSAAPGTRPDRASVARRRLRAHLGDRRGAFRAASAVTTAVGSTHRVDPGTPRQPESSSASARSRKSAGAGAAPAPVAEIHPV